MIELPSKNDIDARGHKIVLANFAKNDNVVNSSSQEANRTQVMRSMVLLLFLVAMCAASLPRRVVAQGGPPLITDDPETPGNGHWEINVAWTLSHKRNARLFAIPLLDVNYGVGEHVQLKAEVPWLVRRERGAKTQSGIGSANFGVKWRFLDKEHGFAMSTYPQLEIRTSASSVKRGLIEQGSELLLPIEISQKLGPVTIDGEVGYQVVQREKDEVLYGLVVGGEINKRLELVGEVHGTAKRNFASNELIFNVGGRFRMSKHYTLLFSTGRRLRRSATGQPTLLAYVGCQFNF